MSVVHDLRVDAIAIGERLRPLSETAVAELAESMRRIGQIQPITIVRPNGMPRLVTGHHRLMAAKRLGLEMISCVLLPTDTSDDDCLQIEIAENLHRNDLSKDERDRHIRLLAEVIVREDARKVLQDATLSPPTGRGNKAIHTRVAEQVGLSKDTVRRALNPEAEKNKRNAVSDAADRAEAKAEARKQREAQQAENDRQREEAKAALPAFVAEREAQKSGASNLKLRTEDDDEVLTAEDRVEELALAVEHYQKQIDALTAENAKFEDMRVQWQQGGYEAVIAGKDEQIRVLRIQVETESAEKVSNLRTLKYWKAEAQRLGWKPDEATIDLKTGEVRNG